MKKELQDKLYEKYPKIFRQKDLDKKQTAMCWGIECGDGWYNLIDQLCTNLQENIDHNSHTGKYPQLEAVQVKEKYGGLRFYTMNSSSEQDAVITFAEQLSETICEKCGSTINVTQTKGWIMTRCETCKEERGSF